MKTSIGKRISASILLFASIFFVPWWMGVLIGMLFVLFFENPYEIFVYGIFLDGIYGLPEGGFFMTHIFFTGTVVFLVLSLWIKEHLMFRIS
jgi:hypothetical protein